jgi:hypothetical protein
MGMERPMTSAERVAKRRAVLRAQGLRARTFWLPDRASAAFKESVVRDTAVINAMQSDTDTVAFIEAVQHWPDADYDWGPDGAP